MIVTWSRILSVEVKRVVVDPRAILEVISTGLNDAPDTAGKEKEYDDSCFSGSYNWNGGAIHKALEETTLMRLISSVLDMLRFKVFVLFVWLVVLFS